jgi:hypothetical protein
MAGPMREKRAWPPPDRDSDGETAAAFEAAVAGIKQTVAQSGQVLSSAKEDLSDHQAWLKAQAAAVEADRERLARLLQRARAHEEAVARRDQKRAYRRARLQAAAGSVKDRVAAVVYAVRLRVWRSIAAVVGGLNAIDAAAARGLRSIGAKLGGGALYAGRSLGQVTLSAGSAVRGTGRRVGSGRLATLAGEASNGLRAWFQAAAPSLFVRAGNLRRAAGDRLAPVFSAAASRAQALAPGLTERVLKAGSIAGNQLRASALAATSLLPRSKPSAAEGENALSLPEFARRFDLSQMLIIAGALLLVSGALMLGGGFLLRAGKPSVAAASPAEPIAWLFEHDSLTLDERSVFAFAATPQGIRIKGFAIGGVNLSDQSLDAVGSTIKPDHQAREIKLATRVLAPDEETGAGKIFAPGAPGDISPQGQFALIFPFPDESGMTPEQVLATFGGVLLKVRYEVEGKEKSFIQYLPPALLERQLAEISAAAKGS